MEQPTFTARQAQAITGISRPVLGDLIKRDIVTPSRHRASGRGDNNLFDVADLFGLIVVEFLRPKTETNDLLRAAFAFWHTADGRRLLEEARQGRARSVIVLDDIGNVSVERDIPVAKLVAGRKRAMLHIVEPNMLAEQLFHDVAMHRMAGDHAEPGPSGREPRRRTPRTDKGPEQSNSAPRAEHVGEGESTTRRTKGGRKKR